MRATRPPHVVSFPVYDYRVYPVVIVLSAFDATGQVTKVPPELATVFAQIQGDVARGYEWVETYELQEIGSVAVFRRQIGVHQDMMLE